MSFEIYAALPLLTAAVVAALAWRAGTHEEETPRPEMVALLSGIAAWCGAYGFEIAADSLELKLFFSKLAYVGIVTIPPALLVLALRDTGRGPWTEPRHLIGFAVIPLVTLVLVTSNEHHSMIWSSATLATDGPFLALELKRGAAYWLNAAYGYACLLTAGLLWARKYSSNWQEHRREAQIVLGSLCIPWIANAGYVFGFEAIANLDLTPFSFALTAVALSSGLLRQEGLWGVVHAVRRNIVHEMSDGVVVVGMDDRLIYLNVAARRASSATPTQGPR